MLCNPVPGTKDPPSPSPTKGGRERGARKEFERLYSGYVDLNVGPSDKNKKYVCEGSLDFWALAQPIATRLNCCTTHVLARKWGHMYNIQQSYHNEHTHFCREMCNIVNSKISAEEKKERSGWGRVELGQLGTS